MSLTKACSSSSGLAQPSARPRLDVAVQRRDRPVDELGHRPGGRRGGEPLRLPVVGLSQRSTPRRRGRRAPWRRRARAGQPLRAAVDELAAHRRRDAHELAALERLFLALDQDRQRPLEHEVDLLLVEVAMDATALARLEHDLVDPEARDAELAAQRQEALADVGVQAGAGDAFVHARQVTSSTATPAGGRGSGPCRRGPSRRGSGAAATRRSRGGRARSSDSLWPMTLRTRDAEAAAQPASQAQRGAQLARVAEDVGVAEADVLDADRRVVQADRVAAHERQRDQLHDASRRRRRRSASRGPGARAARRRARRARTSRRPRWSTGRPRCARRSTFGRGEPVAVDPVVAAGVGGHLALALAPDTGCSGARSAAGAVSRRGARAAELYRANRVDAARAPDALARQPGRHGRAEGARHATCGRCASASRVVQGPRARRPALPRAARADRGREPAHGLPGGRVPERRRVLGARHRDVHDPRRHVHAALRLLQRQDRQADVERPARAGARRALRRADGPAPRGHHERRPRRPARLRRRASSSASSARSAARRPTARSRSSRPTSAARRCRWRRSSPSAPTSSTTTSRSCRGCTPSRGAARRWRALAARAAQRQGDGRRRGRHEVGPDGRPRRDPRRDGRGLRPSCASTASRCSPSASTCARPSATCRSCATGTPTSSRRSRRRPTRSASTTSPPGPLVRSSYHADQHVPQDRPGRRAAGRGGLSGAGRRPPANRARWRRSAPSRG